MSMIFAEPGGDSTYGMGLFTTETGAPVLATDIVHGNHSHSFQARPNAAADVLGMRGVAADAGGRKSIWVYLNALPSANSTFMGLCQASFGSDVVRVRMTSAGVVILANNSNTQLGSNGPTLPTGKWYRFVLAWTITSTSVNHLSLLVYDATGTTLLGSIAVTNGTLSVVSSSELYFGNASGNTSLDLRFSDIYVDNSTALTDPGNIWVTAKSPLTNGTLNQMTGSGTPGTYGSGNARYVNELPVNTSNFVSVTPTTVQTEEYTVEARDIGDTDISASQIIDWMGWINANVASTANSPVNHIIVGGVQTTKVLTTTFAYYTAIAGKTTYPAGGTDIGMDGAYTTTGHLVSLAACGLNIAYIPKAVVVSGTIVSTGTVPSTFLGVVIHCSADGNGLDPNLSTKLNALISAGMNYVHFGNVVHDSPTAVSNLESAVTTAVGLAMKVLFGLTASTLTAANWSTYASDVLTAAAWAQANGVDSFTLGNELEFVVDGTTLTVATLQSNLKTLATSVKSVFTNGNVVYTTSVEFLADWIALGKGSFDQLGWNQYIGGGVFYDGSWKTNINTIFSTWGTNTFISEFAPDFNSLTDFSADEYVQAEATSRILQYIKASGIPRAYFFEYYDDATPYGPTGFGAQKVGGTNRLLWNVLAAMIPVGAATIVAGGKTIILTVENDTWVTTGTTFNAQRQNIINGLTSAQSETNGWNNQVKAKIAVTDVVQTSTTVVTITLDAEASYAITALENITVTVPATALTSGISPVSVPIFNISPGGTIHTTTLTETVTMTDTLIRTVGRTLTETVTMTDTFLRSIGKVFTETVTMTDTVIRKTVRTFTETVTMTDSMLRSIGRAFTETVTMSDSVIRQIGRTLLETVTMTDTFASLKVKATVLTETVTMSDAFQKSIGRLFTETVTLSDTLKRTISRVFTETVTLSDVLIRQVLLIIIETVTMTDSFTVAMGRVFTETVTMTATVTRTIVRLFTETVTLSDTFLRTINKVLTETVTLSDTFIKAIGRTLTETVTLTATFTKLTVRSFTEVITMTDTLIRTVGKKLSETITLSDTLQRVIGKVLTETTNLTDTLIRLRLVTYQEVVTMTDTVIRTAGKVLAETITLTDILRISIVQALAAGKTFLKQKVTRTVLKNFVKKTILRGK